MIGSEPLDGYGNEAVTQAQYFSRRSQVAGALYKHQLDHLITLFVLT